MKLNYKTPLLLLLLVASVSYLYKTAHIKTIKIQPTETTTVLVIDKNSSKSPTPKVSESIRSRVNYLGVSTNYRSR
jgi:hypothetical protein